MVRADQILLGELVQAGGEAFGHAARVHEHDRRTMRADQLEQLRVDRGPDRRRRRRATVRRRPQDVGHRARSLDDAPELGHVLDRDDDLDLHGLAVAGVDDGHGTGSLGRLAAQEPRDLLERSLRGGQADALRRRVRQLLEPFERERQVRAAFRGRHRMDLVDDHPTNVAERLARLRRQHQVQGLRRRDEDVGRPLEHLAALVGRRVAGADADRGLVRERDAGAIGGVLDPGERRAQVLLDVHGQRPER